MKNIKFLDIWDLLSQLVSCWGSLPAAMTMIMRQAILPQTIAWECI